MVMVLCVEILDFMTAQFRSLSLRTEKVRDEIIDNFVGIYNEFYYPSEVEVLLEQKDRRGRTVLELISSLKIYPFLQINYTNRIVSSIWESKTDIGGSIFDLASNFRLACRSNLKDKQDHEIATRFYTARNLKRFKPHRCQFVVW